MAGCVCVFFKGRNTSVECQSGLHGCTEYTESLILYAEDPLLNPWHFRKDLLKPWRAPVNCAEIY